MTVGSGFSPDLLTPDTAGALAGSSLDATYRRWGITPRPENVQLEYRHAIAKVNPLNDRQRAKDDVKDIAAYMPQV